MHCHAGAKRMCYLVKYEENTHIDIKLYENAYLFGNGVVGAYIYIVVRQLSSFCLTTCDPIN